MWMHRGARGLALAAAVLTFGCSRTPVPPSATPSPAPPTPSPTATPPALSVAASAPVATVAPAARSGAPCGVVDTLDYPIGAPDGAGFSARWSFGRLSGRYNGYHAGEDWVALSGNTLGAEVRAIGHGQVVYADPYGWGVTDKAVVIVRHMFPDGESKLSQYGHLEPASVTLRSGACVVRGDLLGRVDKPRGRAHLHFEIRDHMPSEPGPGYWSRDPRRAGWYPPSAYIDVVRVGLRPGVAWTAPFTTALAADLVGGLADGTVLVHDGRDVTGLSAAGGDAHWRTAAAEGRLKGVVIDAQADRFYTLDQRGNLAAYKKPERPPAPATGLVSPNRVAAAVVGVRPAPPPSQYLEPEWELGLEAPGPFETQILALPTAGVAVVAGAHVQGVSVAGSVLWALQLEARPVAWLTLDEQLVLATGGENPRLYSINAAGALVATVALAPDALPGGRQPAVQMVQSGGLVVVYRPGSVEWFEPAGLARHHRVELAPGPVREGQLVALDHGAALIAHRAHGLSELVRAAPGDNAVWRRSLAPFGQWLPTLVSTGSAVFALTTNGALLSLDPSLGDARLAWNTPLPAQGGPSFARSLSVPGLGVLLDLRQGYLAALSVEGPASAAAAGAGSDS